MSDAVLSQATRDSMRRLMEKYPEQRSALLPMLYLVQAEHGYVSHAGIAACAELLDLTKAEVAAVSTFYTMYKREPLGRWLVSVCTQPPCALAGAREILKALEGELGLVCGQTTGDGSVTLEEVECLCICDGAPVVGINYENYEGLTSESALDMVRALRDGGDVPEPRRGERPQPAAPAHRELSGIDGPMPQRGGKA